MNNETLIIIIADGGETVVKAEGHAGPGCKELTRKIENALGETTGDRLTDEYHDLPAEQRQNAQNRY